MISYYPLWDTHDRANIDILDLCHDAGVSSTALDKLNRDISVELSVIADICRVIGCEVEDIVRVVQ